MVKSADKSVTYGHEKLSGVLTFCNTIFFIWEEKIMRNEKFFSEFF